MTVLKKPPKQNPCKSIGSKFQTVFIGGLENGFRKYGGFVARYPVAFILGSVLICGLCCIGITQLEENKNGDELWVPSDSQFKKHADFVRATSPPRPRFYSILLESLEGNILNADTFRAIYQLRKEIRAIETAKNGTWTRACLKVPSSGCQNGGSNPSGSGQSWPAVCQAMNAMCRVCQEGSLLDIWANLGDAEMDEFFKTLTTVAITDKVNDPQLVHGLTNQPLDVRKFLGQIEEDGNGGIVGAKAMTMSFVGRPHDNTLTPEDIEADLEFEEMFLNAVIDNFTLSGVKAHPSATRSFGDVVGSSIGNDSSMLALGYLVVIIYVMVMLGKFNSVQNRALLSLMGIMSVGMGIGSAYGFCAGIGLDYTGLHSILPFLLLGIGIDDMFVIVQSFDNLKGEELALALAQRFGLCMKHAGVAITITSVTDLLAFGIGGTTVLPALMSFCLYAAFGILFVFFYMISFFFAWFVLDQRRMEDTRDAFICCWKKSNWSPNKCSQISLLDKTFSKFADILLQIWAKIVIIVVTLVVFGLSLYCVFQLETNFEATDFIDEGTYLRGLIDASAKYFPGSGISGQIYIGNADQLLHKMKLAQDMMTEISQDPTLNQVTTNGESSFPFQFSSWVQQAKGASQYPDTDGITNDTLNLWLTEYLFGGPGVRFRNAFTFETELNCSLPAPSIQVLRIPFTHNAYQGAKEHIEKINAFEAKVGAWETKFGASAKVFPYAMDYANYVTMEIISEELLRNIGLALACVFIATILLIGDFFASVIVVINVVIVLVDVAGFMYLWGLSIDTVAAVLLTIAMGLSVDYSAHIAHSFMINDGSRNERVRETLTEMGPAVLNGGVSTFLAFALLMSSQSYVFLTFFKIFFLVVLFGIFHGLVFLPVVLSLFGPGTLQSGFSETPVTRVSSAWIGPQKKVAPLKKVPPPANNKKF